MNDVICSIAIILTYYCCVRPLLHGTFNLHEMRIESKLAHCTRSGLRPPSKAVSIQIKSGEPVKKLAERNCIQKDDKIRCLLAIWSKNTI